jgi:hypothetical protein
MSTVKKHATKTASLRLSIGINLIGGL